MLQKLYRQSFKNIKYNYFKNMMCIKKSKDIFKISTKVVLRIVSFFLCLEFAVINNDLSDNSTTVEKLSSTLEFQQTGFSHIL